jgi:uncharacterized protein (DUF1330 family)
MSDLFGYIVVLARVRDRERFSHYVKALPPVYEQFEGRYLCLAPAAAELLAEGEMPQAPQALVMSQFESLSRVQEFWWSEAYQNVAKLRQGTGEFSVMALAGTKPNKNDAQLAVLIDANFQSNSASVFASGEVVPLEGPKAGEDVKLVSGDACDFSLQRGRALWAPTLI